MLTVLPKYLYCTTYFKLVKLCIYKSISGTIKNLQAEPAAGRTFMGFNLMLLGENDLSR